MKESRDILSLFEALSNYEVFTPPRVARSMLDMLPEAVWSNPELKFLDPCTKSGVFLREIFYRLYEGLKDKGIHEGSDGVTYDLDDHHQRINHILKNMVYGIAISELTGYVSRRTLYGVMEANIDKQLAAIESFEKSESFDKWTEEEKWNFVGRNKFNEYYNHNLFNTQEYAGFENEGNIFFPVGEVEKLVLDDGNYEVEDTYFPFIENRTQHRKVLDIKEGKVKFDVIVGNPPYQMSDGGGRGTSAIPVYHKFLENSIKLNPKHITMITPSRWFTGGKGLDSFRGKMLSSNKIKIISDFPEASDCFPGVQIKGGVNYFLWDRDHNGPCVVSTYKKDTIQSQATRPLLEEGADVLIRYNEAIPIYRKVKDLDEPLFFEKISARKPFGLNSNFSGHNPSPSKIHTIKLYRDGDPGYIAPCNIVKNIDLVNEIKVLISKAGSGSDTFPHQILGKPFVAEKKSACTETFIILRTAKSKQEAMNIASYVQTKFFRFLVSLIKNTQNAARRVYRLVPEQDFSEPWSDSKLYKKYGITEDEQAFIDTLIKPLE
jgi:site-specific DNA-methyltransferase (adenine-specific)